RLSHFTRAECPTFAASLDCHPSTVAERRSGGWVVCEQGFWVAWGTGGVRRGSNRDRLRAEVLEIQGEKERAAGCYPDGSSAQASACVPLTRAGLPCRAIKMHGTCQARDSRVKFHDPGGTATVAWALGSVA